ncbi:MAG: nuclear transport factor 2 family protein [Candidatus Acidiferrales bacterium]
MRSWILCACIALTLPGSAFAQQPAAADKYAGSQAPSQDATADPKLAALLEAKVRAAWAAFQKKDKNGYAALLTDDFQAVESDGDGERTKMQTLREVEHPQYTSYLLQLFQVQPLGQHYAFVTYESSMQFPKGSALRFRRVFIGELWTNRDGDWKMMRYQETVVR